MVILPLTVVLNLGATVDDDIYLVVPVAGEWEIVGISIVPNSTVAVDATDYRTTTISVGSDAIASQTTNSSGGSARTVAVAQNLALTTAALYKVTGLTEAIKIASAKTGGSGKVEDSTYVICVRQVRN